MHMSFKTMDLKIEFDHDGLGLGLGILWETLCHKLCDHSLTKYTLYYPRPTITVTMLAHVMYNSTMYNHV